MGGMMGGGTATSGPATLAILVTAGTPVTTPPLPAALPAETVSVPGPVGAQRQIVFQMAMGGMGPGGMGPGGTVFTIDGRVFDSQRDDRTVRLGTIED